MIKKKPSFLVSSNVNKTVAKYIWRIIKDER